MSAAPEQLTVDTETALRRAWGEAIKARRKKLGITQEQLAEAIGVDQTTISWWERGGGAPPLRSQLALADALRTTPGRLFDHKAAR